MPEGDSLHRLAAELRPRLRDRVLLAVDGELAAIDDWALVGRTVAAVEARGKNLLIHCAPSAEPSGVEGRPDPRVPAELPVAVWTHLGMVGRWRVRDSTQPAWTAPPTIALHTHECVAACWQPKQLALLGPRTLLRHPMLARLGPDLLDPDADLDEAVARLRALGPVPLGVALMRQSAVAGIGNVYKSELLFLARRSPFVPVTAVAADELRGLLERARALMTANVAAGGPRRTRLDRAAPRERLWVYERSGRPCRVCGATIVMHRQGDQARSTYACPRCQAG